MKSILLLALAAACVALVSSEHSDVQTASKAYLTKQKAIYELFWHVDQPTTYYQELYQKARSFSIEDNIDLYNNKVAVQEFLLRWKTGMLPRGQVFSVMYRQHYDEVICLFHLLHSAKDFETFYKTAVWARFHVNEQMYVYALSVAVLQREDTKYLHIPPLYEMLPHFFYNDEVINHAYRAAMGDTTYMKKHLEGVNEYLIYANYSGWYNVFDDLPEQKLSYFTEDVGLNDFYFFAMHEYPHWMSSSESHLPKNVRGETYFYVHKQLLVRYYMERLCNGLGEIDLVDWHQPITTGYYPTMHHYNGLPFPQRPVGKHIPQHMYKHVQELEDVHHRIVNVIDSGYIRNVDNKFVDIYGPGGLTNLGNLVQGNADSMNHKYYGYLDHLFRRVLGFSPKPVSKHHIVPSALDIYSTSLRDPIFYNMYNNIVNYYMKYKSHLPSYTHEELAFPGVKIESVSVDKLLTFFDQFDSLLSNAVSIKSHKEAQSMLIKARQYRLNHKPFSYHITVQSDKNTKAMVRVFLGPKYDSHGHELDITENYMNFMQLDEWVVDLKAGLNKVERGSHESVFVTQDHVPSDVLYKKVVKSLSQDEPFTYTTKAHAFPERMILPKGKKEGMPFKVFVYICHFDEGKSMKIESPVWGNIIADGHAMGFPLDRPVHHSVHFTVPNMYMKDVLIYHKQAEELNVSL